MTALSQQAKGLIEQLGCQLDGQLDRKKGRWQTLLGGGHHLQTTLASLGRLHEPASLPDLLPFAFHRDKTVAKAAREAIRQALEPQKVPFLSSRKVRL